MHIFLTILHVVVCVVMVLIVLLQAGKGASMGAAFGGSSQTVFGSGGAGTFLGKMTTVIATLFMLTALSLSYFSLHKQPSLMNKVGPQQQQQSVPQSSVPTAVPGAQSTPVVPNR